MDYGTKTLNDMLKYVKNMTVDEYNRAYEEAIREISKFNSLIETRGMHSVPERKY